MLQDIFIDVPLSYYGFDSCAGPSACHGCSGIFLLVCLRVCFFEADDTPLVETRLTVNKDYYLLCSNSDLRGVSFRKSHALRQTRIQSFTSVAGERSKHKLSNLKKTVVIDIIKMSGLVIATFCDCSTASVGWLPPGSLDAA